MILNGLAYVYAEVDGFKYKGCLSDNYNICNYNILTAQLLSKLSENDWMIYLG